MSNIDKLNNAIVEGLQVKPEQISDSLAYSDTKEWDSVAHMTLVAAIEESFDVMLDTDDIVDMSNVSKIKEILGKYEITF
jgi:acyl carrier protein